MTSRCVFFYDQDQLSKLRYQNGLILTVVDFTWVMSLLSKIPLGNKGLPIFVESNEL